MNSEKMNQIAKDVLNTMLDNKQAEVVFKNGSHIVPRELFKNLCISVNGKKYPAMFGEFNNKTGELKATTMLNYVKPIRDDVPAAKIVNVIFNAPATIVFWDDNTKTVVKAQNGEKFDPEKGLAMAIAKKTVGNNRGSYFDLFNKWIKEEKQPEAKGYENCAQCVHEERCASEISLKPSKSMKGQLNGTNQ
mgnify:CR=1 FL=1